VTSKKNEGIRNDRLAYQTERKKMRRFHRDIEETNEMRLKRLNNEAQKQEIQRLKRDLQ
jgi:hypothetical protein